MKVVLNAMEVVTWAIDAILFILETPLGLQLSRVGMLQEVVEWAEVVLENREVVDEGVDLDLLIQVAHLRGLDGIPEEDLITMHRARARAGR